MHKFCEHDNREPPTLVRLMKGASVDELTTDGITITPHERSGLFVVEGGKRALFADWAARGIAQVQDATAAAVVEQLDIHPGHQVLDRCAGLGTKTLQIRECITETGWIMAVDPSPNRCDILRKSVAARAIGNIAVVQAANLHDIVELKRPAFDRILVDAPCSNSGVMARRPEARYRQDSATIASLTELQDQILDDTAEYLRPGGLMTYCTCSVWPEENQQRIDRFLNTHSYFQMVQSQFTWPSFDPSPSTYHDGGYFALLKRSK
jgi:16S rRNA (cytosine967-C5)-methyltransferase